jgi:hypothetical protein
LFTNDDPQNAEDPLGSVDAQMDYSTSKAQANYCHEKKNERSCNEDAPSALQFGLALFSFAPIGDAVGALIGGLRGAEVVSDSVAVIGRLPDTAVAQDWPGYEVLDSPNWSQNVNDEWVSSVAKRGMDVYTASPTTPENLFDVATNKPTIFAGELSQFLALGYTWDGDYLRAPG